MDLFELSNNTRQTAPLADRMRPRRLEDFAGLNALADGGFLRKMIAADNLISMILFGPPGTGKTTLANIIAGETKAEFVKLNAVSSGVAEIRKVVEEAKNQLKYYRRRTLVFIDEVHRFNKGQQDALLPFVEDGTIILIGATTENPYFEVNPALLSRTRVVRLRPLAQSELVALLQRALTDPEKGLGAKGLVLDDAALATVAELAGGDARRALNMVEQVAMMVEESGAKTVTPAELREIVGERIVAYDKKGDNHYDVASAFIKSMRGSDPDAALHYLARMLAAGEDVKFVARRIVICAAEDVGNADPNALVVATAAAQAVQFIGMPEAQIPLAQAVTYIAAAPKSNAACVAIGKALADLRDRPVGQVPVHLRDSHYKGAQTWGHGRDYKYPHDYPGGYVPQQYLPDELKGAKYYQPADRGFEAEIARRLAGK
ncbi:MAG TPA: replication-associated recombination protein A [Selenomonadales bacterium]|nr:replication-associated recombination protein A [Selenomonadales bacterium]